MPERKSKLQRKTSYILSLHIDPPRTRCSLIHEQWISFSKSEIEDKAREVEADILYEMQWNNDFDFTDDDYDEYVKDDSKLKFGDFRDKICDYEYDGFELGTVPYVSIEKVVITNNSNKLN